MNRRIKGLTGSLLALALAPWSASAQTSGNDYQIGPKDLLEIRVLEVPELNVERRVSDNGSLELPLLGELNVAGLTAPEVRDRIEKALTAKYVNRANVSVVVKEFTNKPVSVLGAVQKPGSLSHLGTLDADQGDHGRGRPHGVGGPEDPGPAPRRQRPVGRARDRHRRALPGHDAVRQHPDPSGRRHQHPSPQDA